MTLIPAGNPALSRLAETFDFWKADDAHLRHVADALAADTAPSSHAIANAATYVLGRRALFHLAFA